MGSASYVVYSQTHFTIVNINAQPIYGGLGYLVLAATMTQASGKPAVTDADLNVASTTLLAAIKGNIPGLQIDPNQVYSLIQVEFPEILTNQIDAGLLAILGSGAQWNRKPG